jgi:oligoendopeptidase F
MSLPPTQVLVWSDLEPRFAELAEREVSDNTLYAFLLEWSELSKIVGETGTFLQLAADLDTADETAQEQLSHFHQVTQPEVTKANAALRRKVLAISNPAVPPDAMMVLKDMRSDELAYREENVPIEAEEADLITEYSRLTGSQMVDYEGHKLTVPEIQRKLQEPDRRVRETSWRAWQKAKLEVGIGLDELFLQLLRTRRQMAKNAGLESFRDLVWLKYHRYDYTPEDCFELHRSIAHEVVPLATELLEQHGKDLAIETLLPWDFFWRAPVDPKGRVPLRPFETVNELQEGAEKVFTALDPELGKQFKEFRNGFCDLGSRPNKMSHAYCASFPKRAMPFVLQNVVGSEQDVQVTLHEFGHAFHGYASMKSQSLIWNHFSATEFVEVPSQSLEVLALPYLLKEKGGFYSSDELSRVRRSVVSGVVHLMTWIGFMDSFQHWIYTEAPQEVTIAEIDAKAAALIGRFMPQTNWSAFPKELGKSWHYHHIFTAPFYYIEYGLSWLGALQLWQRSLRDPAQTLRQYRSALTLGNSRSVPELFKAAGAKFAFDRETIREMVSFLRQQLAS